ncbi:hypothetical protein Scep_010627 [Stephania cephalantha]|uniref:Uncharacterized protein n=1 Tax=Stephania cephalantha TaxID=152367 RepID=A0AAP0JVE5_9MAGN
MNGTQSLLCLGMVQCIESCSTVERLLLDMNAYLQAMNLDPNNCKKNKKEKQ